MRTIGQTILEPPVQRSIGQIDVQIDVQTDVQTDRQIDRQTDGRIRPPIWRGKSGQLGTIYVLQSVPT